MSSSKDKILIVSPTAPPMSGPEIMTAQLLRSPLKDHYHVVHYNISKQRHVDKKAKFDFFNVFFGFIQPVKLLWLMIRHRPVLVYTNMAQNPGGFLRYASFILVIFMFRTKIVVRVMGDGYHHFHENAGRIIRLLIGVVFRRIDGFIVRAEVLKSQFDGLVPADKIHVVYSGIDTDPFRKLRNEKNSDEIVVLFVGYLTQAKGAHDLLRAIPLITARHPNVKFQFMGAKIDIERNINYVKNPDSNNRILGDLISHTEVQKHAEFLGIQHGETKINTFVNADIFILPSYSEAFPTVVLEAMAAGLPIIATPIGALPEVFTSDNITFINLGDIEGIVTAISNMTISSEDRLEQGSQNRMMVNTLFNIKSYGDRVIRLFSFIINENNG